MAYAANGSSFCRPFNVLVFCLFLRLSYRYVLTRFTHSTGFKWSVLFLGSGCPSSYSLYTRLPRWLFKVESVRLRGHTCL
jgi:hypothetical protein